jgi:hypothetical protein
MDANKILKKILCFFQVERGNYNHLFRNEALSLNRYWREGQSLAQQSFTALSNNKSKPRADARWCKRIWKDDVLLKYNRLCRHICLIFITYL